MVTKVLVKALSFAVRWSALWGNMKVMLDIVKLTNYDGSVSGADYEALPEGSPCWQQIRKTLYQQDLLKKGRNRPHPHIILCPWTAPVRSCRKSCSNERNSEKRRRNAYTTQTCHRGRPKQRDHLRLEEAQPVTLAGNMETKTYAICKKSYEKDECVRDAFL